MTSRNNKPIIEVKHLSKEYQIGMDRTYKRFTESFTNAVRHPVRTLRGLTGPKETFWALKDINFEVERGEVLGIIGRNGAGKSTLLKILSRITYPTEGEIVMRGRVGSLLEVGTGFHPELTGRENIFFNGAILGMKKREIDDKFEEIVKFSGVEKFLDTPVKRYSSGMNVRLAFSVAAHLDPEILLVDEVLAVGDAEFQKKCLGKMGEVASEGRTVLFVSHNMGAIADLCSTSMYLTNGTINDIGNTQQIIERYLSSNISTGEVNLEKWSLDRIGEGPIKIIHLSIRDQNNNVSSNFRYGDTIKFCVTISGQKKSECIMGIAIRDNMGRLIYHLNNTDDKYRIILPNNISTVSMQLNNILLNDGNYFVSIWLGNSLNVLNDRVGNCLSFRVESMMQGHIRSLGIIRQTGIWDIGDENLLNSMNHTTTEGK